MVSRRREGLLRALIALVALLPAVRMTWWVLDGEPVQFSDYWLIIQDLFGKDGSLVLGDLVEPYNGHLMVLPKLVYWINAELFAGSNVTLGLYVVLVALIQVALLWTLIPQDRQVHPFAAAALTVSVGALVFAPHGAWSFLRGMSGAAWITANTFAVAAIVVRARGHHYQSHALALFAALSYGTGLAAFGGVLVVAALQERRIPWRDWPAALLGGAIVFWYWAADVDPNPSAPVGDPTVADVGSGALRLLGSLGPSSHDSAAWAGAVVLALALVVAAWTALRPRGDASAAWTGVLVYGIGCVFAIAWGRHLITDFHDSRYGSIAVMVWLPVMALASIAVGPRLTSVRWVTAVPVAALALAVGFGGTGPVRATQETRMSQIDLANAIRVRVAAQGTPWIGLGIPMPALGDQLRALGHYPFTSSYSSDCGLLGRRVDPARAPLDGEVTAVEVGGAAVPRGIVVTARADVDPTAVDCVLVVDVNDKVVGVGSYGWPRLRSDGIVVNDGIRAFAPLDVADPLTLRLQLPDGSGSKVGDPDALLTSVADG